VVTYGLNALNEALTMKSGHGFLVDVGLDGENGKIP
jgi:hypothetical protein